jgi:gamma-glutamylcyclotransferase (GGCT)/AIG2-like uncharacterized protein YtfP
MVSNLPYFVYGTLLFDEIVEALTGEVFASRPATLLDYRRCAVQAPGREGEGPAIVADDTATVKGRILLDLDERAVRILDAFEFESPGYTKVTARAIVQSATSVLERPSLVYIYEGTTALTDHIVGDWNPAKFVEQGMQHYLAEFIPALLGRWEQRGGIL